MEPKDNSPENSTCCSQETNQHNADNVQGQHASSEQDQALTHIQAELDACKASSDQWQQRYIQVSADMQNYKRRMEKEQLSWTRRAQESVLVQILPIVDDFDRALAEHKKHVGDQELSAWIVGFEMISKELYKFLKSVHVTEIAASSVFDPELHEAVAQIEAPEVASGDIVEVVQKGYMLGEEVLRPAKVVVAR